MSVFKKIMFREFFLFGVHRTSSHFYLLLQNSQPNVNKLDRNDLIEEEIQMYTNEVDPLWRRASLGLKGGDSVHL